MKHILRYIFKPSSQDKEAVASVFKGITKTTQIIVAFVMMIGLVFLTWSFVNPGMFMNSLPYHRTAYLFVLLTGTIW